MGFFKEISINWMGEIFFVLAICILIYGLLHGRYTYRTHVYGFCSLILSFACFVHAHVCDDFELVNVFLHSHTHKSLLYKIAGSWASHEGSLFLWCLLLSLYSLLYTWAARFFIQNSPIQVRILNISQPFLSALQLSFLSLAYITSNPFERLSHIPTQGQGLNPVLHDINLAIHPPHLYLGSLGFVIPFVLVLSLCVLSRQKFQDDDSALHTEIASFFRLSLLSAQLFLTVGIILGAFWAYYELGWGGWWYFDPVENLALIPWLFGLVSLHLHFMIKNFDHQSMRGAYICAVLTFLSCLMGLSLIRGGVLQSVHSFADAPHRGLLLGSLALTWSIISGYLLYRAQPQFICAKQSRHQKYVRACMILLLVLIVILLIGTIYPVLAQGMGFAHMLDIAFFKMTFIPLGAVFVCGLVLFYKRFSDLRGRVAVFILLCAVCMMAIPCDDLSMRFWIALCAASGILLLYDGLRVFQNIRRLPHYCAHVSVMLAIIGMVISGFWGQEYTYILKPGQTFLIPVPFHDQPLRAHFERIDTFDQPTYTAKRASIHVKNLATLTPEERLYHKKTRHVESCLARYSPISQLLVTFTHVEEQDYLIQVTLKPGIYILWAGFIGIILSMLVSIILRVRTHIRASNRNTKVFL